MDQFMKKKSELRNKVLTRRNQLTLQERIEKSYDIMSRVRMLKQYMEADMVLVYFDYRSEVITTDIIEELLNHTDKRIFAPKVMGFDIIFYEIQSMEDVKPGYQQIREPINGTIFTDTFCKQHRCFMLVPGTVFDDTGNRMGYGKGFYDRFLMQYPEIYTCAPAFQCQLVSWLPFEEHDVKMHVIVTETAIYKGERN